MGTEFPRPAGAGQQREICELLKKRIEEAPPEVQQALRARLPSDSEIAEA